MPYNGERERERGRRPDYVIKALDKDTQERGTIGAGWLQDDGSIYIKFERFAVVPVGARYAITAFPAEEEGPYERPRGIERHMEDERPRQRGARSGRARPVHSRGPRTRRE